MAVVAEQVLRIRDEATPILEKAAAAARVTADSMTGLDTAAENASGGLDSAGAAAVGTSTGLGAAAGAAARAKTQFDALSASARSMPSDTGSALSRLGLQGVVKPVPPAVAQSIDQVALSAGNLAQRAGSLAQQFADVGVSLAGGISPGMVLIQQGPQIAAALGGAGTAAQVLKTAMAGVSATFAAILPFLAPIAVGIAALTTVYALAANAADQYSDANGRTEERLEALQAKLDATNKALAGVSEGYAIFSARTTEIADRIGVLTGAITQADAAARKEAQAIELSYKAAVKADTQRIATLMLNAQLLKQQAETQAVAWPGERDVMRQKARAAEEEIEQIKARIGLAKQGRNEQLAGVESERNLKNAKEAATKAEKEATAATKVRNASIRESIDLFKGLEEALDAYNLAQADAFASGGQFISDETIGSLRAIQAEFDSIVPPQAIDRLEQLQSLLAKVAAERSKASGQAVGAFDEIEGQIRTQITQAIADGMVNATDIGTVQDALTELYKVAMEEASRRARSFGASAGALMGGDPTNVIRQAASTVPIIGEAIGAALGGIQSLGERGAKESAKMVIGSISSIIRGVSKIPEFIVQLVPRLITQTFPDLIVALVGMIPKLAIAILIELPVAIVRGIVRWWRDIGGFSGLVKNISHGIRDWWTGVWDRIRAWFKDIFTPGDQSKGRGPSQKAQDRALRDLANPGLADLREQQNMMRDMQNVGRSRQTMRPMGVAPSQAAPTIHISSDVVDVDAADRLARRLARQFGPNGRRTSPVLGG